MLIIQVNFLDRVSRVRKEIWNFTILLWKDPRISRMPPWLVPGRKFQWRQNRSLGVCLHAQLGALLHTASSTETRPLVRSVTPRCQRFGSCGSAWDAARKVYRGLEKKSTPCTVYCMKLAYRCSYSPSASPYVRYGRLQTPLATPIGQ